MTRRAAREPTNLDSHFPRMAEAGEEVPIEAKGVAGEVRDCLGPTL